MQILYFAPDVSIDSDGDGRVTHIREVTNRWAETGVSITAVVREPSEDLAAHPNISVQTLSLDADAGPVQVAWHSAQTLSRLLSSNAFDVVYARHAYSLFSLLFALLFRTPHVVEVNGLMSKEQAMASESKIRYWYSRVTEYCYRFSDTVICVSYSMADGLPIKNRHVHIVENGVNTGLFRPIEKQTACDAVGFDPEKHRVGFVGSVAVWQGLESLVDAAVRVPDKLDVEYVLVGDGPDLDRVKRLARDRGVDDSFVFVGRVEYEQVPLYVNTMDVCVAPGRTETPASPLKVFEYLACAKPVIATSPSEIEVVDDQTAGATFEPGNIDEFASKIECLTRDRELADEKGQRGKEHVQANRSWKAVADRVLEILPR